MLYLSWKSQLESIVRKHFPTEISQRFSFRSDADIFIPKEDESIWHRWKADRENMHVLFDGMEILELTPEIPRKFAEVFLLRAFRDSIKEGRLSLDKKIEWTDNATARKNKRLKKEKKKQQIEDAVKFAYQNKDNPHVVKEIEMKLPKKKRAQKVYKLEGGV